MSPCCSSLKARTVPRLQCLRLAQARPVWPSKSTLTRITTCICAPGLCGTSLVWAGTFVNSATAGWLDQKTQHYYTLMQPPGAPSIELFGMSLTKPAGGGHSTVTMAATIGSGQLMSGTGQVRVNHQAVVVRHC
jgi:hypothetical protein